MGFSNLALRDHRLCPVSVEDLPLGKGAPVMKDLFFRSPSGDLFKINFGVDNSLSSPGLLDCLSLRGMWFLDINGIEKKSKMWSGAYNDIEG
jgi:hypothetical protein